jgi:predicted DNA-binding protein (MmcQ/YjbR family)
MNKTHWNTVVIGGDVLEDEIKRMIERSYNLIKPKARKRNEDNRKQRKMPSKP